MDNLVLHRGVEGVSGCEHLCIGFLAVGTAGRLIDVVAQIEQVRVLVVIDDLLVREGCLALGVPVDHTQATVDEAFVVEVAEDADDAARTLFVHGEGCAVPVARASQLSQLPEDDAPVLVRPVPGMAQELLACEVAFADALLGQAFDDLGFGGDGGVVRTGHPAGILTLHAGMAHEDVLDGLVEDVPHVEHTGDVGRRDDHGVRFAAVGTACEEPVVHPILIPFALDLGGAVLACQFHILSCYLLPYSI